MLAAFFVMTFAASWALFFTASALASGSTPGVANYPVLLAGVFAPSIVALSLTLAADGMSGVRRLLAGTVRLPRQARWFALAAGYMLVIKLSAAVLIRATTGTWPAFGTESMFVMLVATVLSTPVQAGEEIGWRGFALPRLARTVGLAPAAIIVGVAWAAWHLPLFYLLPAADTYHQSFLVYGLGVTAISVAMAYLYRRSDNSLLLTMLMHAAVNNTKDIVPSAGPPGGVWSLHATPVGWTSAGLMCAIASYFLVRMRGMH